MVRQDVAVRLAEDLEAAIGESAGADAHLGHLVVHGLFIVEPCYGSEEVPGFEKYGAALELVERLGAVP